MKEDQDPLTAFVSRSLRAVVDEVRSEVIARDERRELERIRFRRDGAAESLILKRVPADDALETALLPFLARKTDRVPAVRSRGIPPPASRAWPWVLHEDVVDLQSACEKDPREIVRAKAAIERAVSGDVPALRALGVPTLTPAELAARAGERPGADGAVVAAARTAALALEALPVVLAHGDLVCANARLTERGGVLVEWRAAHLGRGILDIARLANDLRARGDKTAERLYPLYAELTGSPAGADLIRAAEMVDALVRGGAKR